MLWILIRITYTQIPNLCVSLINIDVILFQCPVPIGIIQEEARLCNVTSVQEIVGSYLRVNNYNRPLTLAQVRQVPVEVGVIFAVEWMLVKHDNRMPGRNDHVCRHVVRLS